MHLTCCLQCRRTLTPARVARLGSVAPLTQLNPESNYVLPKNKHRVTPFHPSAVVPVFFFCLSMGPNLPCPNRIPQSMRWFLGGICGCELPVCSALLCSGGVPALLPTQAVTNLFPLLKKQPIFILSGLGIRDG